MWQAMANGRRPQWSGVSPGAALLPPTMTLLSLFPMVMVSVGCRRAQSEEEGAAAVLALTLDRFTDACPKWK